MSNTNKSQATKAEIARLLRKNWSGGGPAKGPLVPTGAKEKRKRLRETLGEYIAAVQTMRRCEDIFNQPENREENVRLAVLCGIGTNTGTPAYDPGMSKMMHGCCLASVISGTSNFGTEIPFGYDHRTHGRPKCKACDEALDMEKAKNDPEKAKLINDRRAALCRIAGSNTVLEGRVVRHVFACDADEIKAVSNANPSNGFSL